MRISEYSDLDSVLKVTSLVSSKILVCKSWSPSWALSIKYVSRISLIYSSDYLASMWLSQTVNKELLPVWGGEFMHCTTQFFYEFSY